MTHNNLYTIILLILITTISAQTHNKCDMGTCYRCVSVEGSDDKECSRCIFAVHQSDPETGLGSCVPKFIPNCRFHHYEAYPTAIGCELCEKGFKVKYGD